MKSYFDAIRARKIRRLFLGGMTMDAVGKKCGGISRERVRQILEKLRVNTKHGGDHVAATKRKSQARLTKLLAREKKIRDYYGCSAGEYDYIMEGKTYTASVDCPAHSYGNLKRNSARNGIPFKLTFYEWHLLWKASKVRRGGREMDNYIVSRKDKTGPYSFENTEIVPYHRALTCKRGRRPNAFKEGDIVTQKGKWPHEGLKGELGVVRIARYHGHWRSYQVVIGTRKYEFRDNELVSAMEE